MWRAVSRGYVHDLHANFVQRALTVGFDLGFDPALLVRHGRIVYKPYASAMENAEAVSDAICKRIDAHKTLCLGEWHDRPHDIPVDDCLVFPCGAVEKNPLYAPGEYRPVSDHTKSGFNGAELDKPATAVAELARAIWMQMLRAMLRIIRIFVPSQARLRRVVRRGPIVALCITIFTGSPRGTKYVSGLSKGGRVVRRRCHGSDNPIIIP